VNGIGIEYHSFDFSLPRFPLDSREDKLEPFPSSPSSFPFSTSDHPKVAVDSIDFVRSFNFDELESDQVRWTTAVRTTERETRRFNWK